MERAALPGRLSASPAPIRWRLATVIGLRDETSHARSIRLDVPAWPGHIAGQHVDVRLTAEDGYQTERSYSIASAPEDAEVALTVERIEDGEVSPYLTEGLRPGDELELRGPVGGYFNWRSDDGGPLLLIAGGSASGPRGDPFAPTLGTPRSPPGDRAGSPRRRRSCGGRSENSIGPWQSRSWIFPTDSDSR